MIRLRHRDEWVGLIVLAATVLFLGAVLQAGLLRDWFRPVSILRILLPPAGVAGLAVGAEVEVLGTQAGRVRRIVIDPNQRMHAEAEIDDQFRAFIRRDSVIVIRRRYGVAGAAFLDVSRGTGPPLNWKFAVLEATTERAPTESVGALIDEIRQKFIPVLDDIKRAADGIATLADNLQQGRGTVGRLLTDDALIRQAEQTVAIARERIAGLAPTIAQLNDATRRADELIERMGSDKDGLPNLIRRADASLQNLQAISRDVARASPRLPEIAGNVASGAAELPALLTQIQITAAELEHVATQLRGLWLLGGSNLPPQQTRLPATRLQP